MEKPTYYDLELIKKYRLRKGLTQGQAAKLLGIHKRTFSRIENGLSSHPATLKRVADFLEIPMNELIA